MENDQNTTKTSDAVIKTAGRKTRRSTKGQSYKVKGTLKQRRAVELLKENPSTLKSVMLTAGYDETSAVAPQNLTNSKYFKQELPDIVERLKRERDRAVGLMSKRIGKAKYRDLVESTDKLTKNIQLLTGNKTASGEITFKWEQ